MSDLREKAKSMGAGAFLGLMSIREVDEEALRDLVSEAMADALEWAADVDGYHREQFLAEAARLRKP